MQTISIREARGRFSHLVDLAEKGETTIITRHGKQTARVCPLPARRNVLPSLGKFRGSIARTGPGLAETVLRSRREERD
jgi:prevent-host-death family protein